MPKSQTKRAIQARKWRISAREKRRLNTIVTEYVKVKHKEVYEECVNLYDNIVENYSENQNLTKTKEFRELAGFSFQTDEAQAWSAEEEQSKTAETTNGEEDDELANNAAETVEENRNATEVIQPHVRDEVVTIGDTYVEPDLILNSYVVQPQRDIITEAMNETLGDLYDGIDRTEDIESIVNEIIGDLEAVDPDFL